MTRFWSASAVEEAQVSDRWAPADLAIGFRTLWSQLCFYLRSDVTAGIPHGTCASIFAAVVLVSPGKSSQESSLTGSVWQQQRSQPPAVPVPKSEVHHTGYGIVGGRKRKIIHPPWTNAKVRKMTQHPLTSTSARPGPYVWSRFWQPLVTGWMETDLNATVLVASCPATEQPGVASKSIKVLTQAASLLWVPLSLSPICLACLGFCLWWGFWSAGRR